MRTSSILVCSILLLLLCTITSVYGTYNVTCPCFNRQNIRVAVIAHGMLPQQQQQCNNNLTTTTNNDNNATTNNAALSTTTTPTHHQTQQHQKQHHQQRGNNTPKNTAPPTTPTSNHNILRSTLRARQSVVILKTVGVS